MSTFLEKINNYIKGFPERTEAAMLNSAVKHGVAGEYMEYQERRRNGDTEALNKFYKDIGYKDPKDWYSSVSMDKYNEAVEDRLRKEHRYLDTADYLSNFSFSDPKQQIELDGEIRELRRYGREYNAMLQQADENQANSIAFLEGFENNNIDDVDDKNPLKQEMYNMLEHLGNEVNQGRAYTKTIGVTFNNKHVSSSLWGIGPDIFAKDDNEDQFSAFCKDNGYSVYDIKDILGENNVSYIDGKRTLTVDKTNLKGVKLLTEIQQWITDNGKNQNNSWFEKDDGADVVFTVNDATSAGGLGSRHVEGEKRLKFLQGLEPIRELLNDAEKSRNEVLENIDINNQSFDIQAMPFMNEYQMNVDAAIHNGTIEPSKGNSMIEEDMNKYRNLILHTGFSKYQIYTDDPKYDSAGNTNDNFYEITENQDRGDISRRIRDAARDNRLELTAAISGGEYGTMITILDKSDKEGELEYEESKSNNQGVRFFIPGLFTKGVQSAFNSSTEGKTVLEYNSMQQYGYEYELADGSTMKSLGDDRIQLYNKDEGISNINKDRAYQLLHESITEEEIVTNLKSKLFNRDGSIRKGYNYDNDIKNYSVIAANEIYSDTEPITSKEVFNPVSRNNSKSNIYKDEKIDRAYHMYEVIKNNIFRILNKNK